MNSIDERLTKLKAKTANRVAKRLIIKKQLEAKQRDRKPNDPNYLTSKQIRQARYKFGNGKHCMICMRLASLHKAHAVDHCHVTGKVRGILCYNCNMGIAYFKEDVEILKSALRYLEEHSLNETFLSDEEVERLKLIKNR